MNEEWTQFKARIESRFQSLDPTSPNYAAELEAIKADVTRQVDTTLAKVRGTTAWLQARTFEGGPSSHRAAIAFAEQGLLNSGPKVGIIDYTDRARFLNSPELESALDVVD